MIVRRRLVFIFIWGVFMVVCLQKVIPGLWCIVSGDGCHPHKLTPVYQLRGPHPPHPSLISLHSAHDHVDRSISSLEREMSATWHWKWILNRMKQMWLEWESAAWDLRESQSNQSKQRKVLVIPGVLSLTNFAKPDVIRHGGPLGEMVQWADLIAALHVLGHRVELQHDPGRAVQRLTELSKTCSNHSPGCGCLDLIYTDYLAIRKIPSHLVDIYSNRFRVLDAFGTEVMFNDPEYVKTHNIRNVPALGLHLQQFHTLYPSTPDNFFLGFSVLSTKKNTLPKEKTGLLYGKDKLYLVGKASYIKTVGEYVELFATMPSTATTELHVMGVKNMGIVSSENYQQVAARAKVLVGLGDPVEGPGVIEALARGCVFLNPRFVGRRQDLLNGKPTSRKMSSQVPYLEQYVGPPYVYTIDPQNQTELIQTVKLALQTNITSFLPHEFTVLGFAQRLDYSVQHLDFCDKNTKYMPNTALHTRVGDQGKPCNQVCESEGLICEPSLFPDIDLKNSASIYGIQCRSFKQKADIYYPAVISQDSICIGQLNNKLFSCAGGEPELRRVCPCREYMHQQLALCPKCSS